MKLTNVLESIFGSPGRIAVLRRLSQSSTPLSGRQIAELTGLTHRGAIGALSRLVEAGVVKQRRVGRAHQYSLAADNIATKQIILPALLNERDLRQELDQELRERFGSRVVSLMLFGSFARLQETDESDVDLLAVVKDAAAKESLQDFIDSYSQSFWDMWAAPLSVHPLTLEELRAMSDSPLIEKVRGEGRLICGSDFADMGVSG